MKRLTSRRGAFIAGITAIALAASGVAALAASQTASHPASAPGEQAATVSPGPEREVRAYGLSPSEDKPLFTLANGRSVGIVSNVAAKCLMLSYDGQPAGETCATSAGIAEGQGISVSDECGTSGKNRMEITGLAPEGVVAVLLMSSAGTSQRTAVDDGAFKFDGTNPAQGGPYPTGIEWVGSNGSVIGSASLPVDGDHFCLPTS